MIFTRLGMTLFGLGMLFGTIALYFLPALIAIAKKKKNKIAILALNVFGFTGICWLIALVWSLLKED